MMKRLNIAILILLLFSTVKNGFSQSANAVLGNWLNEEKEAKIEIYKNGNKFFGKIIWLKNPNEENGQPKNDTHNPDDKLKSRKIIGLQMMKNFDYVKGNLWENGKIYDPKTGKTYSSKMTLIDNNKLEVRGFVGFSLLGRTTTWTRTN